MFRSREGRILVLEGERGSGLTSLTGTVHCCGVCLFTPPACFYRYFVTYFGSDLALIHFCGLAGTASKQSPWLAARILNDLKEHFAIDRAVPFDGPHPLFNVWDWIKLVCDSQFRVFLVIDDIRELDGGDMELLASMPTLLPSNFKLVLSCIGSAPAFLQDRTDVDVVKVSAKHYRERAEVVMTTAISMEPFAGRVESCQTAALLEACKGKTIRAMRIALGGSKAFGIDLLSMLHTVRNSRDEVEFQVGVLTQLKLFHDMRSFGLMRRLLCILIHSLLPVAEAGIARHMQCHSTLLDPLLHDLAICNRRTSGVNGNLTHTVFTIAGGHFIQVHPDTGEAAERVFEWSKAEICSEVGAFCESTLAAESTRQAVLAVEAAGGSSVDSSMQALFELTHHERGHDVSLWVGDPIRIAQMCGTLRCKSYLRWLLVSLLRKRLLKNPDEVFESAIAAMSDLQWTEGDIISFMCIVAELLGCCGYTQQGLGICNRAIQVLKECVDPHDLLFEEKCEEIAFVIGLLCESHVWGASQCRTHIFRRLQHQAFELLVPSSHFTTALTLRVSSISSRSACASRCTTLNGSRRCASARYRTEHFSRRSPFSMTLWTCCAPSCCRTGKPMSSAIS